MARTWRGRAPRRAARSTSPARDFAANPHRVGDAGERRAAQHLVGQGCDVQATGTEGARYYYDLLTRRPRLGWSTGGNDYFGLFDLLAWSEEGCRRVQVKRYARVRGPSAKWKEAVERLRRSPDTSDEYWCEAPEGWGWHVWRLRPGAGWQRTEERPRSDYVPASA